MTPLERRRAVDLADLSAGFLCHDDGRKAAYIRCVSCRGPVDEETVEAISA